MAPPHGGSSGTDGSRTTAWLRLTATLAFRALARPPLARDLLRVAWRFRARDWYRRAPFLPLSPREYIRWRMYTAYGDEEAVPPATDVERYATWVGKEGRERRSGY